VREKAFAPETRIFIHTVGGSSNGQDEQSRIVLPPETGEQPSLSSGLSDAPWLIRRRPGSLYSIIEYEQITSSSSYLSLGVGPCLEIGQQD
jgi:hypothetical protein